MSAPVSSPPPSLPTLTLPPNESVMNMKIGDVVKAIMSALQQASQSIQTAAQSEPDPTAKAALTGVANTISPSSSTATTTSLATSIPPTTITISQSGASTSATLPGSGSSTGSSTGSPIPLPSTTFMTPVPQMIPAPAPAPAPMPVSDPLMNLRHTKRPLLPTVITLVILSVLGIVAIFLALSDTVAFLAFVVLVSFIGFILYSYGFVQITKTDTELDVTYNLNPFEDSTSTKATSMTLSPVILPPSTEVFYVSDNTFTYSQAPAVCKAYGATLASYSQVEEAYRQGAEWCGYGWSEGGIALFPTQQATWEKLQKEQDSQARIKCGRPGVNGGYFDPGTQFGVNCYGIRPAKKASDVAPSTTSPDGTDRLVAQFQQNLAKYVVSPFNQKVWSEATGNPQDIQLSQTQTPSAATVPGATQPMTSSTTSPASITTATDTLLSAIHNIPTPPIAPPANVNSVLKDLEDFGSAPMGLLHDSYDQLTEFVHDVV